MPAARREQGVAEWTHAGGATNTLATFTCCHCNNVTIVPPRAAADDLGGFCRQCMKQTCKACASGACVPFERKLEQIEARGRLLASMGL